jgi:hypothetical protein
MAEKRSITAREAKDNLEAFGYDGPARWSSIDAFVKANPRAKAAVTANKGALVQSEALGFAQGGAVEPSEEAIKKLADLRYLSYKTGVSTAEMNEALKAVGIDPTFNRSSIVSENTYQKGSQYNLGSVEEQNANFNSSHPDADTSNWKETSDGRYLVNPNYNPNALTDFLAKHGYADNGNPLEFYGDNKATDPIANAFVEKDKQKGASINNNAANKLFAEQVMADQGITADQTSYVTVGEMGMTLDDLKKGYQSSIQIANDAWGKSGYEPEGTDILDTVYSPTKQTPEPNPLPTTIPIEPNQQEVEQAKQVFSPDGKVTLPTGYDQPIQKTVAEQFQPTSPVSGVTTAQAQTFGNNQGQQFAKRATDQAQLIRPQTLAEKTAAGTAPTIQQRLYKNPQGMSTYVTGTVNAEGTFVPTTPIPQGYTQVQQMQTGGLSEMNKYIKGSGGDYSNLDSFKNYDFSQAPFSFEDWKAQAQKEGAGGQTQSASQMNQMYGAGAGSFNIAQQPQGSSNLASSQPPIEMSPGYGGSGTPPEEMLGFTPPTVTTGGQTYTQEQMAQEQGGLDPQAMLDTATKGKFYIGGEGPTWNAEKGKFVQGGVETGYKEFTPEEFAKEYGLNIADFTSGGVQAATSTGPSKTVIAQEKDTTKVSDLDAAQIDQAQTVQGKDELTTLMQDFEGGDTPAWAAGAMRNATAQMQARGLGASSMAGQALIQSAMESALPIAMADASNKQQMAMLKAEQRAKFLGMEFDQNFQAKVMNAAKVSEIANMNFNAEQQVALENAKMAQTVDLANLNNKQALVMAEAAQISQLEMASLSNLQQAQVQNAQNFLQIDMANLNNQQQTEIFKAQTLANTILSDTAAANANEQFNASSQMQVDQFNNTMKAQLNQFNSAQINAMNQFNAGEANAIQKFNSELQNQREMFNSQMYAQIAQANAKWRQDVETTNTAMANQSNFQYAKDVNGLTNKAIDQIWQRERDLMSFAMAESESAMDRTLKLILADKDLEATRLQIDAQEERDKGAFFARFLFGSSLGGFPGIFNLK